jgi:hypothetical protein
LIQTGWIEDIAESQLTNNYQKIRVHNREEAVLNVISLRDRFSNDELLRLAKLDEGATKKKPGISLKEFLRYCP